MFLKFRVQIGESLLGTAYGTQAWWASWVCLPRSHFLACNWLSWVVIYIIYTPSPVALEHSNRGIPRYQEPHQWGRAYSAWCGRMLPSQMENKSLRANQTSHLTQGWGLSVLTDDSQPFSHSKASNISCVVTHLSWHARPYLIPRSNVIPVAPLSKTSQIALIPLVK